MSQIAIYVRAASDEQAEQQEAAVRRLLDRHQVDHTEAVVVRDIGRSVVADRPGWHQVQQRLDAGQVDVLAAEEVARITRDPKAWQRLVKTYGTQIRILVGDAPQRAVLAALVGGMMDKIHSTRIRRGMEGAFRHGRVGGKLPFGFRAADGKIMPDPEEAAVVQRIFNAYVHQKWTLGRIVERLNERRTNCRGHTFWTPQQVKRILRNPRYRGLWRWGATKTVRDAQGRIRQVEAAPEEVIEKDLPETRLVDDATWFAAQAKLAEDDGDKSDAAAPAA